jgi:hypothetical protein
MALPMSRQNPRPILHKILAYATLVAAAALSVWYVDLKVHHERGGIVNPSRAMR